jgi:hypothetical protein
MYWNSSASLFQPLEDGSVTIARSQMTLNFPANCILGGGDESMRMQLEFDYEEYCKKRS